MYVDDAYEENRFFERLERLLPKVLIQCLSERAISLVDAKHNNHEALVSTSEALEFFGGIDRHTLYRYVKQGLPARKIGKSYKFKKVDLERFVINRK